ncbi:MAG: hypothetical protein Q9226_002939 [Calogaya cf. arnoldii]
MHMLCHGYQRRNVRMYNDEQGTLSGIPGIALHYPNSHVGTLKSKSWSDILNLLGKDGEQIMLDLLIDCAVYAGVENGQGNFYQLSGVPLTELQPIPTNVLNRYPDPQNPHHTTHILKYIFPRQFGLHNVFTSTIDPKETVQPFKDYTLREHEITQNKRHAVPDNASNIRSHLPRRLRGAVFDLVGKLQKRHYQCAYYELLNHYCPLQDKSIKRLPRSTVSKASQTCATQAAEMSQLGPTFSAAQDRPRLRSPHTRRTAHQQSLATKGKVDAVEVPLIEYATPLSDVSAFCRAVMSRIIPDDLWGHDEDGEHNKAVILSRVDQFIGLRRFESLTLHAIALITWLAPSNIPRHGHISSSDLNKRREVFLEFLYYLFDSILIPLVRSNFHVTESNLHKNRVFYFRHDVWRALTEPAMARIKLKMFDEVPTIQARQLLDARTLGFSQMRLLPKGSGVRPIMNLRRRLNKLQNGKAVLGRSINSIMAPVHKMLDYERLQHPTVVGSALFSVGDLYPKLKAFKDRLCTTNEHMPHLFFAKLDVKSCFDTIPQRRAIKIMEDLASEDVYRIARHAQIKASENPPSGNGPYTQTKPARKFLASAHPPLDFRSFDEIVEATLACEKKNTVFIDNVVRTSHKKPKLLDLLKDHVERNIVKIGKKFFRQKEGIPQGSVLSSLLCNCFYARLEAEHLPFVRQDNGLLLRLIDDFLYITTKKEDAIRFLQIMHNGLEEYGVEVNPTKSLANFSIEINNTGRCLDRRAIQQSWSNIPPQSHEVGLQQVASGCQSLILFSAFKIQTHRMFLDTNFNSVSSVLSNIYQNFVEAGMKYYRYAKSMQPEQQPHTTLLIGMSPREAWSQPAACTNRHDLQEQSET